MLSKLKLKATHYKQIPKEVKYMFIFIKLILVYNPFASQEIT
jgi:hypothetical protein